MIARDDDAVGLHSCTACCSAFAADDSQRSDSTQVLSFGWRHHAGVCSIRRTKTNVWHLLTQSACQSISHVNIIAL